VSVPQYSRSTNTDPGQVDWSAWSTLGTSGIVADGLVPVKNADGRLEVFALDAMGAIERVKQAAANGAWDAWQFL
jgi:hypothetical protein